jgi:hypothetical protein
VIPLAQKLKMCGVFGANCDVFFTRYNRLEWEIKGRKLVSEWTREVAILDGDDSLNNDEFGKVPGSLETGGVVF